MAFGEMAEHAPFVLGIFFFSFTTGGMDLALASDSQLARHDQNN